MPLPTVLSSHTGGFTIAIGEQTEFMKHLKTMARIGIKPDAALTGYFRNSVQIELMVDTIITTTYTSFCRSDYGRQRKTV